MEQVQWHRLGMPLYTHRIRNTWWGQYRLWKAQTSRTEPRTDIDSYKTCTPCRGPSLSGRRIPPGRKKGGLPAQCTPCRAHSHDRSYTWHKHKGAHNFKYCAPVLLRRIRERSFCPLPYQVPPGTKRHQGTCPVCPFCLFQSQNNIAYLSSLSW